MRRTTRPIPNSLAALVAASALVLPGCGRLFGPNATLGPGSIVRGRGLYNRVISETNNQQTLDLIVRARYGEPLGLLTVASVTANLRTTTTAEAQFGIGADANYRGNLTPLTLDLAYEDNPTIAYAPVQGERYVKSLLSPIGLDVLVLLLGVEHAPSRLISLLVKQVNGLRNPMYGPPEARAAFRSSVALLARLEDAGRATWTSTGPEGFALVLHDYSPDERETVRALLKAWGLSESLLRGGNDVVLPVRLALGPVAKPGLNFQTRSVYDLIEGAATAVEVPEEHAARGIADPMAESALHGLLKIQSSPTPPHGEVLIAVRHRGYWFFIAADDGPSKVAFRLLQSLIGMRLVEGTTQTMPTLTIPVAK
jgi:hypothetical protein